MRYTLVCVAAALRLPLHKPSQRAVPHSLAIRCKFPHQKDWRLTTDLPYQSPSKIRKALSAVERFPLAIFANQ
jgi:hypothetical protein